MQIKKTTELYLTTEMLNKAVLFWLQENSDLPIPNDILIDWNEEGAKVHFSDGWEDYIDAGLMDT